MTRRTVAEWVQFIVVKNIDPREKGVFVRSVDGLVRELERMKEEVKACKDGMVVKERDCCVSDIESVLAMLKGQKQRSTPTQRVRRNAQRSTHIRLLGFWPITLPLRIVDCCEFIASARG